ncbi:hypothetical protein CI109_107303 [Kwoniella shandongensis]|uniref:non-specific serine/threonine protein kinase n=1 Tax=Kwoniella shandongensis TaxID=1734106 RepID=A0AAJ8LU45_9TREE
MSGNTQHHITHRMVPLICQALITSPDNEIVWLEGLRLLTNPKLQTALALSSSIWLPLLLKGLEVSKPRSVTSEALKFLHHVADTLAPIKSCLVKPLRVLGQDTSASQLSDFVSAIEKLDIVVWDSKHNVIGRPRSSTNQHSNVTTPLPPATPIPVPTSSKQHPLLDGILAHNLPPKTRTSQHAWTQILLSSTHDNPGVWLYNLYQATLEASNVPELVVSARLQDDPALKAMVDDQLVSLLSDNEISKDIAVAILDLLAFFDKNKVQVSPKVLDMARSSALTHFQGALNQPLPGIVLWYIEQEAESFPIQANIQNLVEANIRVGQAGYDAAWSSVLWLEKDWQFEPEPIWITQLSHWQEALDAQDKIDEKQQGATTYPSFTTRMICYDYERRNTSHWATAAAWHMGDFEAMSDYLAFHPKGTSKSLYKAIIDVYNGEYASAFHHISKAQSLSYDELQVQLGNGPQTALRSLAKTELLVELQEVIQYKSQPELRDSILTTWKTRFKRSHADPNTWLKRLEIWTLACPATTFQLQNCFLNTAKLCESAGMHEAAQSIIKRITPDVQPPVAYTKLRFEWKSAFHQDDVEKMENILQKLYNHVLDFLQHIKVDPSKLEAEGLGLQPATSLEDHPQLVRQIVSRRYYRLAEWHAVLQGNDWLYDPNSTVLAFTCLAAKLDTNCGFERQDGIAVSGYIVPAIRGLFQAARTRESPEYVIKALLRLVTLWFRFGEAQAVLVEVENQLNLTAIDLWLSAIPQLIARLGTHHKALQSTLLTLLKNISSQYPHAVIWPLLTATETQTVEHQEAARVIMNFICTMPDGTRLVDQAELVGKELIRISISWMERQDLMERAWEDVPALWESDIRKLQLPETPNEEQFVQQFGTQLQYIYKTLLRYRSNKQQNLIHTAYAELYKLYGEIDAQINQWRLPGSGLQIGSTAPKLLTLRDCILTVPGQYDPHLKLDDQAFIDGFHPAIDIVASKQLPRKLVIHSYSINYTFLLKGNEDLRGDERIMQLFKLINTLLNHHSEAFNRNLHLLPYEVVPLSPSTGLVSWVPNTQQLQAIIQANRDKNKQHSLSDKEQASLLGYDPVTFNPRQNKPRLDPSAESDRYDKLPLEVKVERLKGALSHSKQSDLKDVLWQRSPSSEIWIKRRTNFARTIGVGSFVGYIIGLGDRHGSNILVDQLTWGVLHIDFGDLFNVAQERSFAPEKVPFRLTRMMTNAFELASRGGVQTPGSRGTFKQASLIVMDVLRDSHSTLLAMLEAFLYDPLLSWTVGDTELSHAEMEAGHSHKDNNPDNQDPHIGTKNDPLHQSIRHEGLNTTSAKATAIPIIQSENSLIDTYFESDSYLARVSESGMTNSKALHVLAEIERKLLGYNKESEQSLTVNRQVQELIEEATDLKNLSQGYVLGWIPHW